MKSGPAKIISATRLEQIYFSFAPTLKKRCTLIHTVLNIQHNDQST